MAEQGKSFNDLIKSLSAFGSGSADLAILTVTGETTQTRPLTDYDSFANHVFFGNAIRRFRSSLDHIENNYPIGLCASTTSNLSAANIYQVDNWKKNAKSFDLWLLNELTLSGTVTAAATNIHGEIASLPFVRRSADNTITGSQTAVVNSISAEAHLYEDEEIVLINQTAGSTNDGLVFSSTAEKSISRGINLKNMVPEILFLGDGDELLLKLLAAFGDVLDELKEYIDQMAHVKKISYDNFNRTPDAFLPVLAQHLGVNLYQSAVNTAIDSFFVSSTTGATTQEVSFRLWNRIMNNYMHLLKTKGTRECIEAIGRVYGVDHNFLKTNEYSIFNSPIRIDDVEEVDTPVLFSTGDVFVQVPTGSVSAFDFSPSGNFTIEARVSATSATNHILIKHPLYQFKLDASGRAVFSTTGGTSAFSTQSSLSSYTQTEGNFVNVVASRTGNNLKVWVLGVSGSGSGSVDTVVLASGVTSGVLTTNFYSSAGASAFGTYFPGSGSFSGYMHEVRVWNVALEEEDLKEHTRNFESISFSNSTASNSATWGSLKAHYKLKENVVPSGGYNFIVDSTTSSNTAIPKNFQSVNRYVVMPDMKKLVRWYPAGLAADNDKVHQEDTKNKIEDQALLSFSLNPINAVNRDIKNTIQNFNILELLGDPEDLYRASYTGPFVETYKNIINRYNGKTLVDLNTFINVLGSFNDVLGGIFAFVDQFVPAKNNVLAEGVMIENHILERPKYQREDYGVCAISASIRAINTHHNLSTSSASGATTANFQGYRYSGVQKIINNSLTGLTIIPSLSNKGYSINKPKFLSARVGRALPLKLFPSDLNATEVEVTMNRLTISPTASSSAYNGFISGKIRLLKSGRAFKTDIPALTFEFPASSDGNNYFAAEVGDITNGKGRIVSGKDVIFTTKLDSSEIEIRLQASDLVKSQTASNLSLSGSVGVLPLRITNLFSNATQVIRLLISNDPVDRSELGGQGGVKITS